MEDRRVMVRWMSILVFVVAITMLVSGGYRWVKCEGIRSQCTAVMNAISVDDGSNKRLYVAELGDETLYKRATVGNYSSGTFVSMPLYYNEDDTSIYLFDYDYVIAQDCFINGIPLVLLAVVTWWFGKTKGSKDGKEGKETGKKMEC